MTEIILEKFFGENSSSEFSNRTFYSLRQTLFNFVGNLNLDTSLHDSQRDDFISGSEGKYIHKKELRSKS